MLERLARDENSSLLQKFITYSCQKFYDKVPSGQYYKTFLGVIYTTNSVFSCDFDWGYADNDVITAKKVL